VDTHGSISLYIWPVLLEFQEFCREPDTSATGHFGTKTLRHHKIGVEVSGLFGTKALRHFGTKIRENLVPKCPVTVLPLFADVGRDQTTDIP